MERLLRKFNWGCWHNRGAPHVLSIAIALVTISFAGSAQAALIHNYDLNGNADDSLGGPSLNLNGGSIGLTGYTFSAGEGLDVSGAIDPETYSIEMGLFFDATDGFRRLIDFKDRAADTGLYNLDGTLYFYDVAPGTELRIKPGEMFDLVLTRDGATDTVKGYVNGFEQFSFVDATDLATFDAAGNIIQLLRDDLVVPGEESGGFLDYVRIHDDVIVPSAVPEPSSVALLAIGGIGAAWGVRRRRKAAKSAA